MKSHWWLPDTIMIRAAVILAGALITISLVGYWIYKAGAENLARNARDTGLAERIISIKRAIASTHIDEERDKAAHALATASLDVHWSKLSLVLGNTPVSERALAMEVRLRELAPEIGQESFRVGFADEGSTNSSADSSPHLMLISIKLEDGSWINFASPTFGTAPNLGGSTLIFAGMIGLIVGGISITLLTWVTHPLSELALAAERFNLEGVQDDVDENGPAEVRRAAHAFNTMANRIRKLVTERTQALAAVSHDLRTPITRLRLRSELLEDDSTRALIDQDLSEMEELIDSTLEFLKMGVSTEREKPIDIAVMITTLVNNEVDHGGNISRTGAEHAIIKGKPISIKRAFWNVIGNAMKYAKTVIVDVELEGAFLRVDVVDDGPGISETEVDRVFEPFYRIEGSRSRKTGGSGLGLTIAKAIVLEHNGSINLSNERSGGLRVSIRLPLISS